METVTFRRQIGTAHQDIEPIKPCIAIFRNHSYLQGTHESILTFVGNSEDYPIHKLNVIRFNLTQPNFAFKDFDERIITRNGNTCSRKDFITQVGNGKFNVDSLSGVDYMVVIASIPVIDELTCHAEPKRNGQSRVSIVRHSVKPRPCPVSSTRLPGMFDYPVFQGFTEIQTFTEMYIVIFGIEHTAGLGRSNRSETDGTPYRIKCAQAHVSAGIHRRTGEQVIEHHTRNHIFTEVTEPEVIDVPVVVYPEQMRIRR